MQPKKDGPAGISLPFEVNRSKAVTDDAVQSLYRTSERGQDGAFPLGTSAQFHSGADMVVDRNRPICAIAAGEVVAARNGVGPGEHPWGDTGFVLLRHPLDNDKCIYSLFLHLQREVLHPDRTKAGWLRRLLLDGAPAGGKPKWRVLGSFPTWNDEDRGRFSPANMHADKPLQAGIYDDEGSTVEGTGLYLKIKGRWIKASSGRKMQVKQLSPWTGFDLDDAASKNPIIATLRDGKVAIPDADKKDGRHRWTVEAGEPVGLARTYQGVPRVHWSVFWKNELFPTGPLTGKEFGPTDKVKLSEVYLTEERGDVKHTEKLIEALDPQKKTIASMPHAIPKPGEVQLFYRTPEECWRSRYLAVKGLTEFALDVDAFLQQDRHQSHGDAEREQFKKNTQSFLFWKDLAQADDFPKDGKAVFVHPATAMRLMPALLPKPSLFKSNLESQEDVHDYWFIPSTPDREARDHRLWMPPPRAGNEVEFLIDGRETYRAMLKAMKTAWGRGTFIYLANWWVNYDFGLDQDGGTTLKSVLQVAALSGCMVRALFWDRTTQASQNTAEAAFINMLPEGRGHAILDGRHHVVGTHHQKILCVYGNEGLISFCGGVDFNYDRVYGFGDTITGVEDSNDEVNARQPVFKGKAWSAGAPLLDLHCKIRGPAAYDLLEVFLKRYADHARASGKTILVPPRPSPVASSKVYTRIGATFGTSPNAVDTLFTPDDSVTQLIEQAADGPGATEILIAGRDRGVAHTRQTFPYSFAPHGRQSGRAQLLWAISSARYFIYFEDQYMVSREIAEALNAALKRGVLFILGVIPHQEISTDFEFEQLPPVRKTLFIEKVLKDIPFPQRRF